MFGLHRSTSTVLWRIYRGRRFTEPGIWRRRARMQERLDMWLMSGRAGGEGGEKKRLWVGLRFRVALVQQSRSADSSTSNIDQQSRSDTCVHCITSTFSSPAPRRLSLSLPVRLPACSLGLLYTVPSLLFSPLVPPRAPWPRIDCCPRSHVCLLNLYAGRSSTSKRSPPHCRRPLLL